MIGATSVSACMANVKALQWVISGQVDLFVLPKHGAGPARWRQSQALLAHWGPLPTNCGSVLLLRTTKIGYDSVMFTEEETEP